MIFVPVYRRSRKVFHVGPYKVSVGWSRSVFFLIGSTVVGRLLITPILYSQHGSCRLFRNLIDITA